MVKSKNEVISVEKYDLKRLDKNDYSLSLKEAAIKRSIELALEQGFPILVEYFTQRLKLKNENSQKLESIKLDNWDRQIKIKLDFIENEQKKDNPNWEMIDKYNKELAEIQDTIGQYKNNNDKKDMNFLLKAFESLKSIKNKS